MRSIYREACPEILHQGHISFLKWQKFLTPPPKIISASLERNSREIEGGGQNILLL